jgi:putative ABC transport system substrate-binding protein
MWRHLARDLDCILRGERPADLPIEQATEVVLDINVKTAKTLGLTLPSTLVAVTDEVADGQQSPRPRGS